MVTIIIPLYNVEKYVATSLLSAFNQDFRDIEFLLIDDCSTDGTMKIVNEIMKSHFRSGSIKVLHHANNLGLSAARNTGLLNASGEYVFFMDSDDVIAPDCITRHYEVIRKSDADFTVANIQLDGAKSIHIKPIPSIVEIMSPFESYLKRMWSVSACNKLYKRSFLVDNSISFKPGLFHEDVLWSYFIAKKSHKIALVNQTTYFYKIHSGSITTYKNNHRKLESLIDILSIMIEDFGIGGYESDSYFYKYIDFWRLNTALLLLNYDGSYREQKKYYNQIIGLSDSKIVSVYSIILKLPFLFFYLIGKPMYLLYKYITK